MKWIDKEDILYMTIYAIAHGKQCEECIGNAFTFPKISSKMKENKEGFLQGRYIVDLGYYRINEDGRRCWTTFAGSLGSRGTQSSNVFSNFHNEPPNIFNENDLKEIGKKLDVFIKENICENDIRLLKAIWEQKIGGKIIAISEMSYQDRLDYTYKEDIDILKRIGRHNGFISYRMMIEGVNNIISEVIKS